MVYSILFLLMTVPNSRVMSSPTSRCSCVTSLTCTTVPYGRLALDIALLGVHAPCPEPGQVLCCDRSGLEDLYGDSEPRRRLLEQVHLGANSNIIVSPELDIPDGETNPSQVHKVEEIEIKADSDNDATRRPESFEHDKSNVEESFTSVGNEYPSSKCGCIPAGICPQQFKHAGIDQCDVSAGLELCCVDVVDEGEPQNGAEIEGTVHAEGPQQEAQAQVEDTVNAAEPQHVAPVDSSNPNIEVSLGDNSPVVELNEKQPNLNPSPSLYLVPCTNPCTGIPYSPIDTQHRELYGVLAECSSGLVRCIYHLDLQQFIHPDNFNLPVFNLPNFISFLSKWSGDNKSEIKILDDRIGGDRIVNTQSTEGDYISLKEHLGRTGSVLPEEQENAGVLNDSEMPRLKSLHRRFFTSSKWKKKVDDLVNIQNTNRIQTGQSQESLPFSKEVLSSVRNSKISRLYTVLDNQPVASSSILSKDPDLNVKSTSRVIPSVLDSRKQTSKSASSISQKFLAQMRRKDLAEKLIERMTVNLASENRKPKLDKIHMPEPKDITGVEIEIPRATGRVMLHMDKDRMEKKVDEDQLLSMLQALLTALE